MLRIINMRVLLDNETSLNMLAAKRLKIPPQAVLEVVIVRRALDARRKSNISFVYTLDVKVAIPEGQVLSRLKGDKDISVTKEYVPEVIVKGQNTLEHPPVVIGFGPAGMLAALTLAQHGYKPILLERGRNIEQRTRDVSTFWQTGQFDPISNVQFGEGGAGTFSDGKLTTRVNDPLMGHILDILIKAGAPEEITYLHKPHIGTDKLREIVKSIRQEIIALGGRVEFESKVTDIDVAEGQLKGIVVNGTTYIPCCAALFAIGHSARDTYEMLYRQGVTMEAKAFSMGVRIEHPQEVIDTSQYGISAGHPQLKAADYALVYHAKDTGRTAYSFCMCPGGFIVPSATAPGELVVNGMSPSRRDSRFANSGMVVAMNEPDWKKYEHFGPLAALELQKSVEKRMWKKGMIQEVVDSQVAPAQRMGDFLASKISISLNETSYQPGLRSVDMRDALPDFIAQPLHEGIAQFGKRIRGFATNEGQLIGAESRTSSPVRVPRNPETFEHPETARLFPCGEGAGYAGGIVSAAMDGERCAEALVKLYK